jgi:prolyl-tRNA synthetase
MAALAEQNADENGINWPADIAPYQVAVVIISMKDEQQVAAAEKIHDELEAAGIEVILDNRDERPGVKFKDADLWGSPVRIAIGKKGLANGEVEWKFRNEKEFTMVKVEDVVAKAKEFFKE